jgi:SAM-dependent methyltransferase
MKPRPLDEIYTEEFYADNRTPDAVEAYRQLADSIIDALAPIDPDAGVLDVGCGAGGLVAAFRERGYVAWGFDGSSAAIAAAAPDVRPFLVQSRIEEDRSGVASWAAWSDFYSGVVSVEVAEHLPEDLADHYVELIAETAVEWIVFSAAPPGQGGTDHINLQPYAYWHEKFFARGWKVDLVESIQLQHQMRRRRAQHVAYVENFCVLRPNGSINPLTAVQE